VRRALALCVLVLVAGCGGSTDEELSLPPGQHFVVMNSLSPRTSAFGDTLTAELRLLLDRRHVDPDEVRLLHRFLPYRERTRVERVDDGNITALTYTIELDCLTAYCLPSSGPLRFPITRILTGSGPVREVEWPLFDVVTRLSEQKAAPEGTGEQGESWPPAWRAAVSVPEPGYRVEPSVLAWIVGLAGAALLVASAVAGLLLLRRGRLLREREVSPLDRAVALLKAARTDDERRAALEALALALDGDEPLAQPARQLAWSQSSPSADAAAELVTLAKESR
jgi:hypothetical protein